MFYTNRLTSFLSVTAAIILSSSVCSAATSTNLSVSPAVVSLETTKNQQFTATVNGVAGASVKWSVSGIVGGNDTVGTISSTGVYLAPATVPTSAVVITASASSDNTLSATAEVSLSENAAVAAVHEQWLAGVAKAAASYGCSPKLIQQLPTESISDVVKLYGLTADKKTCLVLQPVSPDPTSMRYSLASGGQVDGVDILYLSDVGKVRIWDGTSGTAN